MSGLPGIAAGGRGIRMAAVAMLALLQAFATGASAVATREAFAALANDKLPLPVFALVLIAVAGAAIALLRWTERVVAEKIGQDFAAALRLKLFGHIARLPTNELVKRRIGGLSLRFVGDLTAVRSWVSRGVTRLLSAAIVIPVVGLALFHINPDLAIAALLPVVSGLVVVASAGPALLQAHRHVRRRRARLAADVTERLPHAGELRLLGRLSRERDQIKRRTAAMIAAVLRRQRRSAFIRAVPDVAGGLAIALMLWVAWTGSIPGAEAAGAIAALGMLVQKMRELGSVWDRYCAWSAARARCLALLTARPLPATTVSSRAKNDQNRALQVRLINVSENGLKRIDAVAEPGQKIGITGPSGAGKSSLLRLIAGMQRPLHGRVELDQILAIAWVGSAKKRILYLNSGSPILAGSLRRTLTMGAQQRPNDEAIESVARSYGLGGVLKRLGGLDGRVAESGRNLSSGEIRRMLLTRAALTGGDLLLLDDLHDAMDCSGRALVRKLIHAATATVLVVSQDATLLRSMDKIWKLDRGKLTVIENRVRGHGEGRLSVVSAHPTLAGASGMG
jgi:ABC-type transport system involved in cytochrome bd biosynthesis fused ATPase/permease subunit